MAQPNAGLVPSTMALPISFRQVPNLVLMLLREHFYSPDNFQSPELQDWVRSEVKAAGFAAEPFYIAPATLWDPAHAGQRPAVIVRRDPVDFERFLPADREQGNLVDGDDYYQQKRHGGMTCFCIGDSGEFADLLAEEVSDFLCMYSDQIRQLLGLLRFVVVQVGARVELEAEARERYAVPVTIAYSYAVRWAVRSHLPKFYQLVVDATGI